MRIKRTVSLLLILAVVLGTLASCSRQFQNTSDVSMASSIVATPQQALSATAIPELSFRPEAAQPEPVQLLPELERIMDTINALCTEPRPLGSAAERKAAQYLQGRLQAYGYLSTLEPFAYDITSTTQSDRYRQARELTGDAFFNAILPGSTPDGESQNVVAKRPNENDNIPIVVLSAHYDSTYDSIGVVDNASGVAVVLEAARILAQEELPFSLRIAYFGGEESILIGSRMYLMGLAPEERSRIIANINVDTVAYSDKEEFVALTSLTLAEETPLALTQASPVAAALLADSRVIPSYGSRLVGDHMSFAQAGIDSITFCQSWDDVSGLINSPSDTYELLAPQVLPAATQVLVNAVRELAIQVNAAG